MFEKITIPASLPNPKSDKINRNDAEIIADANVTISELIRFISRHSLHFEPHS